MVLPRVYRTVKGSVPLAHGFFVFLVFLVLFFERDHQLLHWDQMAVSHNLESIMQKHQSITLPAHGHKASIGINSSFSAPLLRIVSFSGIRFQRH